MAKGAVVRTDLLTPLIDTWNLAVAGRNPKSFSASAIGDCGRQLVYGLLNYERVEPFRLPEWERMARVGDAIHAYYQDQFLERQIVVPTAEVLQNAGLTEADFTERSLRFLKVPGQLPKYAVELPLPQNPYQIGGRVDAIVRLPAPNPENAAHYIVDIKSVSPKHLYDLRVEAVDGQRKVSPASYKMKKYKEQLLLYMHFLKIPYALIMMVDRETVKHYDWRYDYDPVKAEALLKRVEVLQQYLTAEIVPPAEPSYGCAYCPFSHVCDWGGPAAYPAFTE